MTQKQGISQKVAIGDPRDRDAALKVNSDGSINVTGAISAETSAVATAAAPSYVEGTENPLSMDLSGQLRVTGGGGSSGALVNTASPTYGDGDTEPLSLNEKGGLRVLPQTPDGADVDLSLPAVIAGADGSGAASNANPVPVGVAQGSTTSGQYGPLMQGAVTTGAPTYTNAQTSPFSLDTTGQLRVTGGGVAQGSTTSGQTGNLIQAAVTTAAPTYTTAQTSPLSLTTAGDLRTVFSNTTIAVTQGTASNLNATVVGALAQGSTTSGQGGLLGFAAVTTGVPSYTNAQSSPLSLTTGGQLRVQEFGSDTSAPINSASNYADSWSNNLMVLGVASRSYVYNGTSWDRGRSISASFGSATGVAAVEQAGASWIKVNANASATNIKASAGILHKVVVNTKGASANVLTLYDTSGTTTTSPIAVIDTVNINSQALIYDLAFASGLAYALATGTAADVTIVYR